jgi:uncharacterized repeat protein (TIGR01451 family)
LRLNNHLPNRSYELWLNRNGSEATLLASLLTDTAGKATVDYKLPLTLPLKAGPGREIRSYSIPDDLPAAETELTLVSPVNLTKTAPTSVTAGSRLTYTLRLTNELAFSLTNLVITDAIPSGANYVSGGTKVGQVVSWTVQSLAAGMSANVTFVVTAARSITNSNYGVQVEGGYLIKGLSPIVTGISGGEVEKKRVYLPAVVKN